jgi:hypothetical protein
VREMLEFVPAKLIVIEEHLTKCVCKKCADWPFLGYHPANPDESWRRFDLVPSFCGGQG